MFKSFGFVSKRQRQIKEENPNPQITFEENRFVLNQAAIEALGNPQYITFAANEGVAINEPDSIHTLFIINADNIDCWKAKLPKNGSFRNKKLFKAIEERNFIVNGVYNLEVVSTEDDTKVLSVSLSLKVSPSEPLNFDTEEEEAGFINTAITVDETDVDSVFE